MQPRVQFVEDLLNAVGQASAGQNLEGTTLCFLRTSVKVSTCWDETSETNRESAVLLKIVDW